MKKQRTPKIIRFFIGLPVMLAFGFSAYGQESTTINDIRNHVNSIKNGYSEALIYAEKIVNASSFNDAKINAKQILTTTAEMQKNVDNSKATISGTTRVSENTKYQRKILNISSKVEDLQNKINYINQQLNKIPKAESEQEAKSFASDVMHELEKTKKTIAEIEEELTKAEQSITTAHN